MSPASLAGLVLMGGGARAAYQVGVLQAMAGLLRERRAPRGNPFPVLVGTSAGAINGAALACGAADFVAAAEELAAVWSGLRVEHIYRADSLGVIRSGARWLTLLSLGWLLARWWRQRPRSLLDNRPLAELLHRTLDLRRIDWALRHHHLRALAVTASSYSSGQHVTFYQALSPIEPWSRSQRLAERTRLTHEHLLASAAIPFVFPAVPLQVQGQREHFGDGSMRQTAPISPAVHLGAQRILVIGAGRLQEPPGPRVVSGDYPSLAQIAGHALSNIFLDALAVDVERARRINHTLSLLGPEARDRTSLRPLDLLVIAPSQRLDDLAARHVAELPPTIRALLRALGVSSDLQASGEGAALASYLLFEPGYVHSLMDLGRQDTLARRTEVEHFLGLSDAQAPRAVA